MTRAVALFALASCVDVAPAYHCTPGDDPACVDGRGAQGRCEISGNCSYPDPMCGAQGSRYADSADPGRAGVCVLSPGGSSTTAAQPIGASHVAVFEMTTPAQTITFDTEVQGTDVATSLHWFDGPCPPTGAEQPSSRDDCTMNPSTFRITVVLSIPGPTPYCLVAADDPTIASGHVGVRVFPQGSGVPPCVR